MDSSLEQSQCPDSNLLNTAVTSEAQCEHSPEVVEEVSAEVKTFVISETLLPQIAEYTKQKSVYRARVAPCVVEDIAIDEGDGLVGNMVSIPCTERGKNLASGDSVVLMRPKRPSHIEDCKKESQILQKLEHKNIIGLIAAFSRNPVQVEDQNKQCVASFTFMAVEAVIPLGNDLVSYTQNFKKTLRPVPMLHIGWFLEQLVGVDESELGALPYMHSMKIYHRDLKPDNVLINEDFHLKLIDFGMASADGEFTELPDSGYFAPDVNTPSASVDYWGVGVLIWHMVSEHLYGQIRRIVERDSSWIKDIRPEIQQLLGGLLEMRPEERWGQEKVMTWLIEQQLRRTCRGSTTSSFEDQGSARSTSSCEDQGRAKTEHIPPEAIPYPWPLSPVKPIFCVTLPEGFVSQTLGDLKLNTDVALIVMIDQRRTQLGCFDWLCNLWKGRQSKDDLLVVFGRDTLLKAGSKIYFGLDPDTEETEVQKVLDKLGLADLMASVRTCTAETPVKQLHRLANDLVQRDTRSHLVAVMPTFEAFKFPDHCAEAVLGFDRNEEGRNALNLRNKFDISVVALASADGIVRNWWPGPAAVVKSGDQGLVMTQLYVDQVSDLFEDGVSVTKLQALVDKRKFRQKLGLTQDKWNEWQEKQRHKLGLTKEAWNEWKETQKHFEA